MNYILFDDISWNNLLPLTYTRPVCEIRAGITTIREKWEKYLGQQVSYLTQGYLSEKYTLSAGQDNVLINGSVIPNNELLGHISALEKNQALTNNNNLIATRIPFDAVGTFQYADTKKYSLREYQGELIKINWLWEIFSLNHTNIENDFKLLTQGRKTEKLSPTNNLINKGDIFVEKGAKIEFVTLNASQGPIYIGKGTEIMEGTVVRGPFALCDHSTLKIMSKIYGPTTIGPHCKIGGEINNSVFFAYSNKAHDGFLGNSVIGEWCNIGADTNCSNLKNNYAEVRLWNYGAESFVKTGLQFCGLIMGDHSKCGINTMFNTGTVVGVSANIFGDGFPRNFIPSFSWGGAHGFTVYKIDQALDVAEKVMERRNIILDAQDKNILNHIFEKSSKYRLF